MAAAEASPGQETSDQVANRFELRVPAVAENVPVVRHAMRGYLEIAAATMSADLIEDILLAVTEASTNVVRHAYRDLDAPGEIELAAWMTDTELSITITDRGAGMAPRVGDTGESLGLGLPIMASIAPRLEITAAGETGTRVTISFARD